jgi:hypothetical protein
MCKVCADWWFKNITKDQLKEAILDRPLDDHTKEVLEWLESEEEDKI